MTIDKFPGPASLSEWDDLVEARANELAASISKTLRNAKALQRDVQALLPPQEADPIERPAVFLDDEALSPYLEQPEFQPIQD